MFNQVVVGIDGMRSDRDAVAAAEAIAPDAQLDLVTVYPDTGAPLGFGLEGYRDQLRDEALRRLDDVRVQSGARTAAVHAVCDSTLSRGLKRHARDTGADLIVLGASEHGVIGRALLGDFARGVLHDAPCPVLSIARSHSAAGTEPRVIGVAFDSSREAQVALDLAVELARTLQARIELVEALEIGVVPAVWGIQIAEYLDGLVVPEQERLQAIAEALPVPATATVTKGSAAQVLRRLSTHVDLMVCGSRGWGTAGRIALGSTADRLLHHSPCPVLVVPRAAEEDGVPSEASDVETSAVR